MSLAQQATDIRVPHLAAFATLPAKDETPATPFEDQWYRTAPCLEVVDAKDPTRVG